MKFSIFNFKFSKLFATIILVLFFLFPGSQISAACPAGLVPCGTPDCPCTFCDIFALIDNILDFLLSKLLLPIAALMFISGGFFLLVARGSPGQINRAKSILTATTIGLVIIFVAWVFLNTFLGYIGVAKWTGLRDNPDTSEKEGWWQIKCEIKPLEQSEAKPPGPNSPLGSPLCNKKIMSLYGYRNILLHQGLHRGIDIGCEKNEDEIEATADGIVSLATRSNTYGNVVFINHKDNYQTVYAHLDRFYVTKNREVKKGEVVGLCGNTGRSTGPHLHYEVRKNEEAQNINNYYGICEGECKIDSLTTCQN